MNLKLIIFALLFLNFGSAFAQTGDVDDSKTAASAPSALAPSALAPSALAPTVIPPPVVSPTAEFSRANLPTLRFNGGAVLSYFRPQEGWVDEVMSIYYAYSNIEALYDNFGIHAETRFRETPFRNFYTSNVWFEEVYGYYKQPNFVLKFGKEYSHFGHFWDGSIYGNVMYWDGMKLNPDEGFSLEGQCAHLNYFLQYFVHDGSTNGSQDATHINGPGYLGPGSIGVGPRDTIGIIGKDGTSGRRRNEVVARAEPYVNIGQTKLTFGASFEYLLADIPTTTTLEIGTDFQARRINVHRTGLDFELAGSNWSVFGEYAHQHGQTVVDFPLPNEASTKTDYYWTGVQYKSGKFRYYFNYSDANYFTQGIHDVTEVPGITYEIRSFLTASFEYGYWFRTFSGSFVSEDNSLNFYLTAAL